MTGVSGQGGGADRRPLTSMSQHQVKSFLILLIEEKWSIALAQIRAPHQSRTQDLTLAAGRSANHIATPYPLATPQSPTLRNVTFPLAAPPRKKY